MRGRSEAGRGGRRGRKGAGTGSSRIDPGQPCLLQYCRPQAAPTPAWCARSPSPAWRARARRRWRRGPRPACPESRSCSMPRLERCACVKSAWGWAGHALTPQPCKPPAGLCQAPWAGRSPRVTRSLRRAARPAPCSGAAGPAAGRAAAAPAVSALGADGAFPVAGSGVEQPLNPGSWFASLRFVSGEQHASRYHRGWAAPRGSCCCTAAAAVPSAPCDSTGARGRGAAPISLVSKLQSTIITLQRRSGEIGRAAGGRTHMSLAARRLAAACVALVLVVGACRLLGSTARAAPEAVRQTHPPLAPAPPAAAACRLQAPPWRQPRAPWQGCWTLQWAR